MALIDGVGVQGPRRIGRTGVQPGAASWRGIPSGDVEPRDQAQATGTLPGVGLDGLLALQESVGQADADRPAREHGRQLLDSLAALQRTILAGGDPAAVLQQLEGLAEAMPGAADPVLVSALRAIRLRVCVELARRAV